MKRLSAVLVGTLTATAPIGQIALAHWVLGSSDLESDWRWGFDLGRCARYGVCRAILGPMAGPRLIFLVLSH